jgi:hypothetical protein
VLVLLLVLLVQQQQPSYSVADFFGSATSSSLAQVQDLLPNPLAVVPT